MVSNYIGLRQVAYMVYVMNSDSKGRLKPDQLWPLPTDEPEDRGQKLTQDEFVENMKRLDKAFTNGANA